MDKKSNVAMKGGGYYSLATLGAKHVIDGSIPLILRAIDESKRSHQPCFVISDMGCADGGTSLGMMGAVIKRIRSMQADQELMVVYSDQPRNDYNALFNIVLGNSEFASYLPAVNKVRVLASATSFYEQILPCDMLNLGFSATAMHWLSAKPTNISDHIHMVGASGSELTQFREQARRDWQTILWHRAQELSSGGYLVLINFGIDEQGRYLGNTGGVNMFDCFNQIWQGFLAENIISIQEYTNMTLPQYYNTVEEFSAPLKDSHSALYAAGLRLEQIETRVVKCPFAADFQQHGDADKFAKAYIPTLRSWTEATFFAALDTQRSVVERQDIIDNYYTTYAQQVRTNPVGHGMDYVHCYKLIKKL